MLLNRFSFFVTTLPVFIEHLSFKENFNYFISTRIHNTPRSAVMNTLQGVSWNTMRQDNLPQDHTASCLRAKKESKPPDLPDLGSGFFQVSLAAANENGLFTLLYTVGHICFLISSRRYNYLVCTEVSDITDALDLSSLLVMYHLAFGLLQHIGSLLQSTRKQYLLGLCRPPQTLCMKYRHFLNLVSAAWFPWISGNSMVKVVPSSFMFL